MRDWQLAEWVRLVSLVGSWVGVVGAIGIIVFMLRLGRALRRERDAWWAVDRIRVAQMVDLSARIYLLESRKVTAGMTLRNPTPGETP